MKLPNNFDWQFYLENNPDLIEAGISSQREAEQHWIKHGHNEDRKYVEYRINKSVVNCYHINSSSGIGDFLRGSIYLAENYADFNISFDHHPISQYLSSRINQKTLLNDIVDIYQETTKQYTQEYTLSQLEQVLNESISTNKYICSMYSQLLYHKGVPIHFNFQNHHLQNKTREWFQDQLVFSLDIKDYYSRLNLFNFDVAHVRLGDFSMLQDQLNIQDTNILEQTNYKNYNPKINSVIFDILKIQSQNDRLMIVMSDNDVFKSALVDTATKLGLKDNFKIIHADSNHCSTQPGLLTHSNHRNQITDQQLFNIVLDLYTMSKSKNIYSYSVYPWGSGFSYSIAKIYDIPLMIQIVSNE